MDKDLLEAIRRLQVHARELDLDLCLVGALASEVAARKADLPRPRGTNDADFAIILDDWARFHAFREKLLSRGFSSVPGIEHRFRLGAAMVDVIPFGPRIAAPHGKIVWPDSHHEMVVVGLAEAHDLAETVDLGDGVQVPCVSVAGLVLLKIVSYMDRKGTDKGTSDAGDLLYWFENYASGSGDDRRFDVLKLGLPEIVYENAGAALLGSEVGKMTFGRSQGYVEVFLETFGSPDSAFVRVLAPTVIDDEVAEKRRLRVAKLVQAFGQGFRASRQIVILGWHTSSPSALRPTFEVYYDLLSPAPLPRLTTSLMLDDTSAFLWQRISEWIGSVNTQVSEHRVELHEVEIQGTPEYFGHVAVASETLAPYWALEIRFSYRFGSTEVNTVHRKWKKEEIPDEARWWIEQIDRRAWKAMQEDISRRSRPGGA